MSPLPSTSKISSSSAGIISPLIRGTFRATIGFTIATTGDFLMISTILVIILILMLVGALPTWGYSSGWGYGPGGIVGLLLIVVIVLALSGRI
jgi:hypothetical protein